MNDQEEGHSSLFFLMLMLGILGMIGLFMVAAGAGMASGI